MVSLKGEPRIFFVVLIIVNEINGNELITNDLTKDDDLKKKILTEFMNDFENHTLKKLDYRNGIVLGKYDIFRDSTRVIFHEKPHYIVGNHKNGTIIPKFCSEGSSLVFLHVDDLTDSELVLTFAILRADLAHCRLFMISIDDKLRMKKSSATMRRLADMDVNNAVFARLDHNSELMRIYSLRISAECRSKFHRINTWAWGKGFRKSRLIFNKSNDIVDLKGCPMAISTIDLPSTMNLRKKSDGSVEMISGLETRLVKSIARLFNFSPVIITPRTGEQWWVAPNGSTYGIIDDVAKGRALIGIGKIRPTVNRMKQVDVTAHYDYECLVWIVPKTLSYERSITTSEFSPLTWSVMITIFFIACGLVILIKKSRKGKLSTIFELISVSMGYAIPSEPKTILGKLFFIYYLNYSRVIIIAYSASLASISTTTYPEPTIRNEQGIINAGLRITGGQSLLDLIEEMSIMEEADMDLKSRFEVIETIDEALKRIEERRDIAYVRHYSTVNYLTSKLLKAGKPVKFYALDGCILFYHSVIVMKKGSQLIDPIANVLLIMKEAGIYDYWKNIDDQVEKNDDEYKYNFGGLMVLKTVFFLYLIGVSFACVTFFAELLVFKLRKPSSF